MKKVTLKDIDSSIQEREEKMLCERATPNSRALRAQKETGLHVRPPFALDRDRIMYSGAFRRYTGKTQVVYFASMLDEQLTSRSLHTISVAQIAKTIGRMLTLNVDLIEAIALGHDLGHPPFGHDGEYFLSEVSRAHGLGDFNHNIQSLRTVDKIAKKGKGLNLTFQTRDGIISHNGEVNDQRLEPFPEKTEEDIEWYIREMAKGNKVDTRPQTMEGCVVRITDTIAYIGQDIEDAIRIGLIKRSELPAEATRILGSSNGEIIETLVNDVVMQSYEKNYVAFSASIAQALFILKKFNYARIYKNKKLKVNHSRIKRGFTILFDHYLADLKQSNISSEIFRHFLNSKIDRYRDENPAELIVRDFIAGMTDRYFTHLLKKLILPEINFWEVFD